MSALTFETLSAELTQALAERSTTPPDTVVRCTLGRDKVMVLVEYPLNSAKAEPLAHQTLDWLEQDLRSRFDTTGLPDEVADLSDAADQVSVQLYLKHLSEAKPFTMRLFIWKVGDSFSELFGEADTASELFAEPEAGVEMASAEVSASDPGRAIAVGSSDAGFFSMPSVPMPPVPMTSVMLPDGEEEQVLSELEQGLEKESLLLGLESDSDVGDALSLDLDSSLGVDFESAEAEVKGSNNLDLATDFGLDLGAQSDVPLAADLSARANSGDALDADLSKGVSLADVSDYPSTDFTLPGEAPAIASSDLDLPTVDSPIAIPPTEEGKSPDFFNLVDASDLSESELLEPAETPPTETLIDFYGDPTDWTPDTGLTSDRTDDVADDLADDLTSSAIATGALAAPDPAAAAPSDLFDLLPAEVPLPAVSVPNDAVVDNFLEAPEEGVAGAEGVAEAEGVTMPSLDDDVSLASSARFTSEAVAEENLVEQDLAEQDLFEQDPAEQDLVEEAITISDADMQTPVVENLLSDSTVSSVDEPFANGVEEVGAVTLPIVPLPGALAIDDLVPDALSDFSLDAAELAEREIADSAAAADLMDDSMGVSSHESSEDFNADLSAPLADADRFDLDIDRNESASESNDVDEINDADPLAVTFDPVAEDDGESADSYSADYASAEGESIEYEYEDVTHDHEAYADDPVYYLDDEDVYSNDGAAEDYEEDVAAVDDTEVQRQRELWQQQTKSRGNPLLIVGAVGLLFAGVVGFFLTRPCSVGSCDRIETAQLKGDEALDNLRIDDSFEAVTESKKELKKSVLLLEPIPVWSSYYDEAQAILPEYDRQLAALDLVSEAQGKAYSAAVDSQNPPHSVSEWQGIASDWRAATTALSGVPEDSPVRELADRKLVEYRSNLSTVLVRIESESGAEVSLRQAQQAANQATQQMSKADSSEAWEAVLADWETAVENLRRIPQGTSAYAEAQQLLPDFEKTLRHVRDRAEQERSAGRMLFRAQQLANEAQDAEVEELWTSAVERWNLAVIQLKDVPEGVFARSTAQSLLTTYTGALAVAENNMQVSLRFQPVEPSFYLVCGLSDVQKCSYSMKSGKVRLDLVQGYDSVINESITPPPQRAGLETSTQLVSQSNQLLQQITLLSTQAQIPVELYDANGDFLASYRPDLDGFVRQ